MSIPDPTIDPITGLPLVTSGPGIDSIPLGVQSFPWNDYKAETLPPRSPIAPDDLIPVHANVAGQTPDGNLHLIQSTTQQHLITRESVFQNKGAAIPTGTTAPVDVNVVSGGGGGGTSPVKMLHPWWDSIYLPAGGANYVNTLTTPISVLYGWLIHIVVIQSALTGNPSGDTSVSLGWLGGSQVTLDSAYLDYIVGAGSGMIEYNNRVFFPFPWDMLGLYGHQMDTLTAFANSSHGVRVNLGLWYT